MNRQLKCKHSKNSYWNYITHTSQSMSNFHHSMLIYFLLFTNRHICAPVGIQCLKHYNSQWFHTCNTDWSILELDLKVGVASRQWAISRACHRVQSYNKYVKSLC